MHPDIQTLFFDANDLKMPYSSLARLGGTSNEEAHSA
jgi:hypothetical protein